MRIRNRAMLANGRPLPDWLSAADGGLLIGQAPPSVEHVEIKIIAILDDGSTQERFVTIQTRTGEIQPLPSVKLTELPQLFRDQLGSHTRLASEQIAELARWLAA